MTMMIKMMIMIRKITIAITKKKTLSLQSFTFHIPLYLFYFQKFTAFILINSKLIDKFTDFIFINIKPIAK